MRGLLLVRAKGLQLPVRGQHFLHGWGTEAADQLVLQVPVAHEEAELLHLGAVEVGTEAGALERAPELALLARVGEPGQPYARAARAVERQVAADRVCAPDRQDGDAITPQIAATTARQRLQRDLVADALDQYDCARLIDPRHP